MKKNEYESYFLYVHAPEPPRPEPREDLEDKEEDKQERVVEMQI